MTTITVQQLTDQAVFIHLEITCWSGRKTLQPEDLGLTRASLPPGDLVSLGDKTLIDPATLQVFTGLRAAARRACLAVGVRFLGGYLVPVTRAQPLLDRLDQFAGQFEEARRTFLAGFETRLDDWIQAHPGWSALLTAGRISRETVAGRLGFAVQAVQLADPTGAVQHPGLDRAVGGLAETLFRDVGVMAGEVLEQSLLGRTQVTRRALRPLVALRDKLDGLSFLDHRVRPVVGAIDDLLASLPRRGPLQGRDLEALIGFLSVVEQPARLKAHGARLRAAESGGTGDPADPVDPEAVMTIGDREALIKAPDPVIRDIPPVSTPMAVPDLSGADATPAVPIDDGGWFF